MSEAYAYSNQDHQDEQTADSQPANESFADYVARVRKRIEINRKIVLDDIEQSKEYLAELDREMRGVEAYDAAMRGKTQKPARTSTRRARNGSRREALLSLITDNNGLSRGEIIEYFGLKGDKSGEMSVSNALTALTKRGEVSREGGKYYARVSA